MTENTDDQLECSFCGKKQNQVKKLIAGPNVYICDECIDLCHGIIAEEAQPSYNPEEGIPSPKEIHKFLDDYVIGQDEAKMVMSVAVHNHYKRLSVLCDDKMGSQAAIIGDVELGKSNILLMGPTGSGKTLLAQSISRMLNVPFTMCDATTLTEAGYVGEDVENIVLKLLQASEYDVEKAQRGIIFVDEVDKISRKGDSPSITRDVSGEGVQQALLKIIEGTVARVPPQGGRKHPQQEFIQVDTTNILFIVSGAFVGLDDIIADRIGGRSSIGFSGVVKSPNRTGDDDSELLRNVEPTDLTKYGLIPEFIGRLPVQTHVNQLTEEQMVIIQTEPRNAILKQYQSMFALEKVDLEVSDDALGEIAKICISRKTGARGLRSAWERVLLPIMYELPEYSEQGITKIIINGEVIRGEAEPLRVITEETEKEEA